jgi:hypothetical protein
MTLFGKILVVINLALSLAMATWAFGVWSNRIDFSNTKGTGEQAAGEFARRSAQIEALSPKVAPALAAWENAQRDLTERAQRRLADLAWFQDEMDHLRNKATRDDPARMIAYAAEPNEAKGIRRGEILLDETGRPVVVPAKERSGAPLQSLAHYVAEEQKVLASMEAVQKKHADQINEAVQLTERLVGTPGNKGLQQRLQEERRKRIDVVAEEEVVRPQLINGVVDSELILKRRKALEARIEELKKVGVAVRDR